MSTPARTTLITTPTFARHSPDPWTLLADGGAGPLRPYDDRALPYGELLARIAGADALVAGMDPVTAEVMDAAPRLKVIAKHGVGTDTIDVAAARDRGIPVVFAPGSNSRAVAEYTFGLVLDAARRISASHTAVTEGGWPKLFGPELHGRTLGVVGFGRIGRLVAGYARAFGMSVLAHDPYVPDDAVTGADAEPAGLDALLARADVVTLHVPKTPETVNLIDADAIGAMVDGARLVNCARGELVDLDALLAGLESGRVAGAALDVFPSEPFTEHPLFERDDVVVTPHLGASTAEAQDRAGVVTAEQVRAALTGRVVTNAVNIAAVRPDAMEALAPFVPLCERLGRLAQGLGGGGVDHVSIEFHGRIADHDTRLLGIAVLVGILSGHTEVPVNLVNAPAMAEERGIELTELSEVSSEDFTELIKVRVGDVEVAGTGVGPRNVPYLVGVWGHSFYMPFGDHLAIFRYDDRPGMIGRVGTAFGEHGVNIVSAAVGAEASGDEAVMALTTDGPVPDEVVAEIVAGEGFFVGRGVDL